MAVISSFVTPKLGTSAASSSLGSQFVFNNPTPAPGSSTNVTVPEVPGSPTISTQPIVNKPTQVPGSSNSVTVPEIPGTPELTSGPMLNNPLPLAYSPKVVPIPPPPPTPIVPPGVGPPPYGWDVAWGDWTQYSKDAQEYMIAQPTPDLINPRDWAALSDYSKQLALASWKAKGYDEAQLTEMFAAKLPQWHAPMFGLVS
jgi:hypothetical protein